MIRHSVEKNVHDIIIILDSLVEEIALKAGFQMNVTQLDYKPDELGKDILAVAELNIYLPAFGNIPAIQTMFFDIVSDDNHYILKPYIPGRSFNTDNMYDHRVSFAVPKDRDSLIDPTKWDFHNSDYRTAGVPPSPEQWGTRIPTL